MVTNLLVKSTGQMKMQIIYNIIFFTNSILACDLSVGFS